MVQNIRQVQFDETFRVLQVDLEKLFGRTLNHNYGYGASKIVVPRKQNYKYKTESSRK